MRLRLGVLVLCCAALGRAADSATFESFFLTFGGSKQLPPAVLLTESELREVVAVASDYCRKTSQLGHSAIVFEARMRAIEAGAPSAAEWEQEQIADLERRKGELLAGHIAQLKGALGDRFETYVDSWHAAMRAAPRAAAKK